MKLILYVNCLPTNYSLINLIFWFIFLPQKKKKSFFFCIDTKELQTNFFSIVSIVKKFGDCTSKCIDLMPQKGRFIARLLGRFNSVTLPSTRDVVASLPCTFSSIEFSMSAEVNKLFGLSLQNFQFPCNKLNIAKYAVFWLMERRVFINDQNTLANAIQMTRICAKFWRALHSTNFVNSWKMQSGLIYL